MRLPIRFNLTYFRSCPLLLSGNTTSLTTITIGNNGLIQVLLPSLLMSLHIIQIIFIRRTSLLNLCTVNILFYLGSSPVKEKKNKNKTKKTKNTKVSPMHAVLACRYSACACVYCLFSSCIVLLFQFIF